MVGALDGYKSPTFEEIVTSAFAQNRELKADPVKGIERVFPVGWGIDQNGKYAYFYMGIIDTRFRPVSSYSSHKVRGEMAGENVVGDFYFTLTVIGSDKFEYDGRDAYTRMNIVEDFGFAQCRRNSARDEIPLSYLVLSDRDRLTTDYFKKYDKLNVETQKLSDELCREFMLDFRHEILLIMKKYQIKLGLGKVLQMPLEINGRRLFYTEGRKYFMVENKQKGIWEAAFVAGDIYEKVPHEDGYLPKRLIDSYNIEVLGMIENGDPDPDERQMVMFSRYTSEILWENKEPRKMHRIAAVGDTVERVNARVFAGFYYLFYK